jgi:hypothetical protein
MYHYMYVCVSFFKNVYYTIPQRKYAQHVHEVGRMEHRDVFGLRALRRGVFVSQGFAVCLALCPFLTCLQKPITAMYYRVRTQRRGS